MNLARLMTRRAAMAAPLVIALGLHEDVEADSCTKKCKKKDKKEQRQKCLKQCKKKEKDQQSPPQPQAVQLSGSGPQITPSFFMVAGRYIATSSISATDTDNFIIWLHGPGEFFTEDLVVNEIPDAPGSYQYQSVIQVEDTVSHFLEVKYAGG